MIGQLLTGRYLILENLGTGGFSETYLARDKYLPRHPLCVVKCLKPSANNAIPWETAQRFFETEAHLLERLGRDYHQIPTLFAYCQEQDQVYLVQEYVEGENLSRWLAKRQPLTAGAAIKFLLELLPVLDYIHAHRVIHRDITPSNLIRRRRDGKIVLIDFGAACVLPETATSTQPDSEVAPLAIGTPGYMPDEQLLGMSQLNSDLYALGILVIHLLTGTDPRQFKQDLISGELDWQRYLHSRSIDSGLIAILNRLVRSRAVDRYARAADVLADLYALPAVKRQSPQGSQFNWHKWAQQTMVSATVVVVLAIVGGWHPNYTQQPRWLINLIAQVVPSPPPVHLTRLQEIPLKSRVEKLLITPNNRVLVAAGTDRVLRLWSVTDGKWVRSLSGHTAPITTLASSLDSTVLISGSADGMLRFWDLRSGKLLRSVSAHRQRITTLAVSPDARTLVSGSQDGTLRQWNLSTGALLQTLTLPRTTVVAAVYTTPDQLISAGSDRQLQVWNLATGQLHRIFAGHRAEIVGLQVARDQTLFSFDSDRGLMWDLNREVLVKILPDDARNSLIVSVCDRNLMTIHKNGHIRLWIPKSGKLMMQEAGTLASTEVMTLSSDHRYLANWNGQQTVQLWQIHEQDRHAHRI